MLNIPISQIKEKIIEKSGMSSSELDDKIKTKLEQLSGLISEEGAAHIIANEVGVNLMQSEGLIKIKDLLPAMKNVEIAAKITRKFELRTFQNDKRSGKFAKFVAGDETGTTMVVMWNDATDGFEELKEGDIVKLSNISVRDNGGRTEIHMSESGNMSVNPEGVEISVAAGSSQGADRPAAVRKKIKELKDNDSNVEIFSTIVQVFDPKFWETDPETGKKVKREEGAEVPDNATYGAVLNLFVDDGSDNVRVVLWKNQILNLLKITEEELMKFREEPSTFEPVKTDLLGMVVKLIGRVSNNEMFNRLEFVANVVLVDVDPDEETKNLEKEKAEAPKAEPAESSSQPASPRPAVVAPAPKEKVKPEPSEQPASPQETESAPAPVEQKPEEKKPEPKTESESYEEELLNLDDLEDLEE